MPQAPCQIVRDFPGPAVLKPEYMMKTFFSRFASPLLIAIALAASPTVRAQDAPGPLHPQDDKPKTPLAEQMGGIAKDFRSLRKIVNNPAQKDAASQLVKDMIAHATKAKDFEPAKAKDISPADKDQFLTDFRKQLDGLIADFQKLRDAVDSGKTADASALLDKLNADKRAGHKKFSSEK